MKRILFLSASHAGEADTATRNLEAAFSQIPFSHVRVDRVDAIKEESRFGYLLRPTFSLLRELRPGPRKASGFESALASVNLTTAAARLQEALEQKQPDVVVATSPIYGALVGKIYSDGRERDFAFVALVTEPGSETSWAIFPADSYIVTHEASQQRLISAGVTTEKIKVFGYPVRLAHEPSALKSGSTVEGQRRILFLVNCARRKAPKILERMLQHPDWQITAVIENDDELKEIFLERAKNSPDRLKVLSRLDHLPRLLQAHDVVVSRALSEIVHEAVAAGCPLIAPKATPGEERYLLAEIKAVHAGTLAEKPRAVVDWLDRAFRDKGALLALWKRNLVSLAGNGGTEKLCRFLVEEAGRAVAPPKLRILPEPGRLFKSMRPVAPRDESKGLLLCDLHTHTTWSDGKLSVRELVDFYGERGFDCLCVTDHLCDPQRLLGKLVNLTGLVIAPAEIGDYFAAIEREKKRAWAKYDLLLMTGVELNKDGYTAKSSTHLLGIDLKEPINPSLNLKELIQEIHKQGGLAVASHPHEVKGHWGKNTLYLWKNLEEFAPLIDAWEVANRDDIFNPVGLKKLPFIANSDFHKPKHIYSWKTLLYCEKEAEAIKQCIRVNRDVSLTLYRDHRFGTAEELSSSAAESVEPPRSAKKRA